MSVEKGVQWNFTKLKQYVSHENKAKEYTSWYVMRYYDVCKYMCVQNYNNKKCLCQTYTPTIV